MRKMVFILAFLPSCVLATSLSSVISDALLGLQQKIPHCLSLKLIPINAKEVPLERDGMNDTAKTASKLIAQLSQNRGNIEISIKRSAQPMPLSACFRSYPDTLYAHYDEDGLPIGSKLDIDGYPFIRFSAQEGGMSHDYRTLVYRGVVNNYCVAIDVRSDIGYMQPYSPSGISARQSKKLLKQYHNDMKQITEWITHFQFKIRS